jgi:FlaA1/EpsC-like NDP-sugar epimerase
MPATIVMLERVYALMRKPRFAIRLIQVILFASSAIIAFLLRFEFTIPAQEVRHLQIGILVWAVVKTSVFILMGLDRGWWRYVSVGDLGRLATANLLGSALAAPLIYSLSSSFPRSIYAIDLLVCILCTAGVRLSARVISEFATTNGGPNRQKRCLIYGAGDAGVALLRELHQNSSLGYEVRGFLDDNPQKAGVRIQGASVLGDGAALERTARLQNVELILIAMPSASGAQMTRVLERCNAARLAYKTVPSLAEVIEESDLAPKIREVAVEDLLGRSSIRLEQDRIAAKLDTRVVLVTGAGGSIGSELCRQIARFHPAAIVAYELAETSLFHLQQEMARLFPGVPFYPEIGSIQNSHRLAEVFGEHRPAIVYHAAAYKHVPMMESHAFEAMENNVFGTMHVALAAALHGVEDFVMISSDKAVRPTNIMGATKRLAELVVRSVQNGGGKFVSVRFGNVLGSNGSVVPIFKDQIARGGPVTVTHPEMRRYFMIIPEACQLVLQSSTMGQGGEIFVLDMGDPVRIVDLARNLILLSGLRPDQDIKIEFIGTRPGEKLYEELSSMEEDTLPTCHEKIKSYAGASIPWPAMEEYLARVQRICAARELNELVLSLKEIVPEYNPSTEILRRVLRTVAVGAA